MIVTENDKFDASKISKFEPIIKAWKRDLWKGIEERSHFKSLEDLQKFPAKELYKKLDDSEQTKYAICILKSLVGSNKIPSRNEHCTVRDYLITNVLLNNASRPGALANMTLEELYRADEQEDGFVVSVKEHKTKYKGPAHVAFTKPLYKRTMDYVKYIRNIIPHLKSTSKGPVFVGWRGLKMASSLVSTQFDKFWKRCVGDSVFSGRVNPTLVRKQITTDVHAHHKDKAQATANHLAHSLTTAQKSYNIVNKQRCAAAVSKSIATIQRGSASITEAELVGLFGTNIEEGKITIGDVKSKLSCSERYKDIGEIEQKKLLDKVRYKISKRTSTRPKRGHINYEDGDSDDDDETEEVVKDVAASNESDSEPSISKKFSYVPLKRVRKEFTHEDNSVFLRHLGKYVNSDCKLIKAEISEFVMAIPQMSSLVERFGIQGLIVKIRTERKKLKK